MSFISQQGRILFGNAASRIYEFPLVVSLIPRIQRLLFPYIERIHALEFIPFRTNINFLYYRAPVQIKKRKVQKIQAQPHLKLNYVNLEEALNHILKCRLSRLFKPVYSRDNHLQRKFPVRYIKLKKQRGVNYFDSFFARYLFENTRFSYLRDLGITAIGITPSTPLKETNENQSLTFDKLDEISKIFAQTLPSKESNETYEEWRLRCEQFCFDIALNACLDEEQWDKIEAHINLFQCLTDRRGRSLFLACVEEAPKTCVQKLLAIELAIDRTDRGGNHALHIAVINERIDIIPLLTSRFLDKRNIHQETALHKAILNGNAEITQHLIKEGLNRQASLDRKGIIVTPLELAVMEGKNSCITVLLDPTRPGLGLHDWTPSVGNILHLALLFGRLSTLKFLLNNHHKETITLLEGPDDQGRTILSVACFLGDEKVVEFLVKDKKANIEASDIEGNRPIHWAVKGRKPHIILRLASLGAKLNVHNQANSTAKDLLPQKDKTSRDILTENALLQAIRQKDFLLSQPLDFTENPPENLIFQGGGPKGLVYIGALEALQERDLLKNLRRVAGTSAGAITAALVAFRYSPSEIKNILLKFDLKEFLDPSPGNEKYLEAILRGAKEYKDSADPLSALKKAILEDKALLLRPDKLYNLLTKSAGLCEGEKFRDWMDEMIAKKVAAVTGKSIDSCRNLTFGELEELIQKGKGFRHLHVFASNFSKDSDPYSEGFSSEDEFKKDVIISDAIRCSMSIPGIFKPAQLYVKRGGRRQPIGTDQYIDGGLRKNFPLEEFDRQKYTKNKTTTEKAKNKPFNRASLGISIQCLEEEKTENKKIENTTDLIMAVANIAWNSEQIHLREGKDNEDRTIVIPIKGVSLLDFDLTDKQKAYLLECGKKAVKQKFATQDSLLVRSRLVHAQSVRTYPHFVGRTDLLKRLEDDCVIRGIDSITVRLLWGLGGMGKSELARKFASNHREDFSFIEEFDCENQASLEASYRAFIEKYQDENESFKGAEKLGFPEIRRRVHRFIENQTRTSKPWLIIFDNIEKVIDPKKDKGIFPEGPGCVLLTSRRKDIWENVNDRINIRPFSPENAIELLKDITGEPRTQEMEKLAEALEYFPVAISKAAHYIEQEKCGIKRFLMDYQPEKKPLDFDIETSYKYALARVWDITLQALTRKEPEAIEWLNVCSYLHHKEIPVSWIKHWLQERGAFEDDPTKVGRILRALFNYDLIQNDQTKKFTSVSVHHLIQEAVKNTQSDKIKTFREVFYFLKKIGSNKEKNDFTFSSLNEMDEDSRIHLILNFINIFDNLELISNLNENDRIEVLETLSNYTINGLADFRLGIFFSNLGVNICEHTNNRNRKVAFFDLLADAYAQLRDFKEAEKNYLKELNLKKEIFGETSIEVAMCKISLAYISVNHGKQEKNKTKIEQALIELEKSLEMIRQTKNQAFNYQIGCCLGYISLAYSSLSELENNISKKKKLDEQAVLKEQEALKLLESHLSPDDPDLALSLRNMGETLIKQGRHQEAKSYIIKGIKILNKINDTSIYMGYAKRTLGELYFALSLSAKKKDKKESFLKKAEKKYLDSITIFNRHLSADSFEFAKLNFLLGNVYEAQNQLDLALESFKKSLDIKQQYLKEEDLEIKTLKESINRVKNKKKHAFLFKKNVLLANHREYPKF